MTRFFTIALLILSFLILPAGPAMAQTPLAVLKSEADSASYSDQHLGTYDDDWNAFKGALENANVRYDTIGDQDLLGGVTKLSGYKMVILPLLVDIPSGAIPVLQDYVRGGGKILITDGGGVPTNNAQQILRLTGVQVDRHSALQDRQQLNWVRQPQAFVQEFSVGTMKADVTATEASAQVAKWLDKEGKENGTAISCLNGNTFMTWCPGLQGEVTANSQILSMIMDDAVPNITQQAAVQISFADYQNIQQELDYLSKRTDEAIKTAKQADLTVQFKSIQSLYDSAQAHVKAFQESYSARRFYQADDELKAARNDFAMAFAQAMPVRPVEARAIWLDRGTIAATRGPEGLAAVFDKLQKAGINIVYFETNNAGFCMFPTKVSQQNPQTLGWDPLAVAVQEAHKRGMEIHAWLWIFNVGNLMHNPIVGKDADYPGPVLPAHDFSWALAASDGALLAYNQHELWIDPCNPDARKFAKSLLLEVAENYPVDGIQFDYIRYPFNGKGTEMGYDWVGRTRFERETGFNLDKLNDETREIWQAWKIAQVTSFVKDTSQALRKARPGLRISAAVYALPKRWRLSAIQQEWETWVANGWVDTINPMTYVTTPKELQTSASYVRESSEDKALVFPGLSIRQLDTAGLIEQLDTSRAVGTLGTTMFAVAQLDDKKVDVLRLGPYRRMPELSPQQDPLRASRILIDDFAALVNRYLQDPHKHILSDQASTNDVLTQIEEVQRQLHDLGPNASAAEIATVNKNVANLESQVKNWLRIEAFVQRGFRAQYITSYLSQVEAILSYATQRAQSHPESVVENTSQTIRRTR